MGLNQKNNQCSLLFTDKNPTLPNLTYFHGINIAEQIGKDYHKFGTLLLADECGAVIDSLQHGCRKDPFEINHQVLTKWVSGGMDRSWRKLIIVLEKCGLTLLVGKIRRGLLCKYLQFVFIVTVCASVRLTLSTMIYSTKARNLLVQPVGLD